MPCQFLSFLLRAIANLTCSSIQYSLHSLALSHNETKYYYFPYLSLSLKTSFVVLFINLFLLPHQPICFLFAMLVLGSISPLNVIASILQHLYKYFNIDKCEALILIWSWRWSRQLCTKSFNKALRIPT